MTTHDTALPITTLLPETAADPVILFDQHAALRFAIVERDHALGVSAEEWDRPGVYILLDPPAADGSWGCYVGKAPAEIRTRLRDHIRNKDHWRRAVLIQRDTTFGFNSAQVAWLEGRLYDLLDAAEDARPHNGNRPSDETRPPFERASLENAVLPISRILRLIIGYDPATADDTGTVSTTTRSTRTSRFVGISLKQVIDGGYLAAGTPVTSTNSVRPGTVNADGTIAVNGTNCPTPLRRCRSHQGRRSQRMGLLGHRRHDRQGVARDAACSLHGLEAGTSVTAGPACPHRQQSSARSLGPEERKLQTWVAPTCAREGATSCERYAIRRIPVPALAQGRHENPANVAPVLLPPKFRTHALSPQIGLPEDHPWRTDLPDW